MKKINKKTRDEICEGIHKLMRDVRNAHDQAVFEIKQETQEENVIGPVLELVDGEWRKIEREKRTI